MADKFIEQAPGGERTSLDGTEKFNVTVGGQDYYAKISTFGTFVNPVSPLFKNLIINGDMQVAQRGTSFTGLTGSTTYTLDRWLPVFITLGTWTVSQDTDAPSGTPHRRCIKLLVTTADAAPAAGDNAMLRTRLEGQFLQPILKGTSSAKQLTISFQVKSSTTGTYIVELQDVDNTRHVAVAYTINSANTWESKTVAFPADTTGVLDNDANASLNLNFWLAAGSNFTSGTLATSWAAEAAANRAVGQTNLAGTVNNYIQFTGVQLETGATATAFEFLPFDTILLRCMRYYQKSFQYSQAPAQNIGLGTGEFAFPATKAGAVTIYSQTMYFTVPTRVDTSSGTLTFYNPAAANGQARDGEAGADCSAIFAYASGGDKGFGIQCTGNAGTVAGNRIRVHWTLDTEL